MIKLNGLTEEWKDIAGFEDFYQVSNMGQVKVKARYKKTGRAIVLYKEKIRKTYQRGDYLWIALHSDTVKCKSFRVHRLVAAAFVDNPAQLPQVNHIDGDKKNNVASNLEYVSNSENCIHAIVVLRNPNKSKLQVEDVLEIRSTPINGTQDIEELAWKFHVDPSTIRSVLTRKNWKHVA